MKRSPKPNADTSNDRRSRKPNAKTPDEGGFLRTKITRYCWNHGACDNHIKDCPNRVKALAHQKDATFDSKNGRSKERH